MSVFTNFNTVTESGTLGALNDAVNLNPSGLAGVSALIGSGTLAANIIFEFSVDNGITWSATYAKDNNATAWFITFTFTNPNSATMFEIYYPSGTTHVRARVSSYTSGSATMTLSSSGLVPRPFWLLGQDPSAVARILRSDNLGNLLAAPSQLV